MKSLKNAMAEPVEILVKTRKYKEAEDLLTDFDRAMEICSQNRSDEWVDGFLPLNNLSDWKPSRKFQLWRSFARRNAHILKRGNSEWPAHKVLLQLAVEHADDSPLTIAAEKFLADGKCNWQWLRRGLRVKNASLDPCVSVFCEHTFGVGAAIELRNGNIISGDKNLYVWDVANGKCEHQIGEHTKVIKGLKILPDGNIVSWADDIKVWDKHTYKCVYKTKPLSESISEPYQLPDGRYLVYTSDNKIVIFNSQGEVDSECGGHNDDIEGIKFISNGRFVTWDYSKMCLRSTSTGKTLKILEYADWAEVLPANNLITCCHTKINFRDAVTGKIVKEIDTDLCYHKKILAVSENKFVSESNFNNKDFFGLMLWSLDSDQPICEFHGHTNAIAGAKLLAGNRLLTWSEDKTLRIWNCNSGECLAVLKGHLTNINGVLLLSNGNILSWGSSHYDIKDFRIRIWSSQSGDCIATLEGHTKPVVGAIELSDGKILSWSSDASVRIWDYTLAATISKIESHASEIKGLVRLPHRRSLTWAGNDPIRIWDNSNGQCLKLLVGHTEKVENVVAVDGDRILSWSNDQTVRIWDSQSGECLSVCRHVWDTDNGHCIVNNETDKDFIDDTKTYVGWSKQKMYSGSIDGAILLLDGRLLTWTHSTFGLNQYNYLLVWNSKTGICESKFNSGDLLIVSELLPDGRVLALLAGGYGKKGSYSYECSNEPTYDGEGNMGIWDSKLGVLKFLGESSDFYSAKFLPDGRLLSNCVLWDTASMKKLSFYNVVKSEDNENAELVAPNEIWQECLTKDCTTSTAGLYSSDNSAVLAHKNVTTINHLYWQGDSFVTTHRLFPDGRAVVTQDNGQVCFLQAYQGNHQMELN
ncbi:MAG: WD40 repeat domain-containing protein [Chlorobium sp.]|nr:WD40 repeat domain-containing protein [Chlorobium sp.]